MTKKSNEEMKKYEFKVIERDTIMVVMELINGGGLNDYVKNNKVSDEYSNY